MRCAYLAERPLAVYPDTARAGAIVLGTTHQLDAVARLNQSGDLHGGVAVGGRVANVADLLAGTSLLGLPRVGIPPAKRELPIYPEHVKVLGNSATNMLQPPSTKQRAGGLGANKPHVPTSDE